MNIAHARIFTRVCTDSCVRTSGSNGLRNGSLLTHCRFVVLCENRCHVYTRQSLASADHTAVCFIHCEPSLDIKIVFSPSENAPNILPMLVQSSSVTFIQQPYNSVSENELWCQDRTRSPSRVHANRKMKG